MATESVVSALRVLEAVAEAQPVGLSELARRVELPKSTVQRILLTLQEVGWLRPASMTPTRWQLTYRVMAVVGRGGGESLRDIAVPVMSELQLATTETIHLTAPEGDTLVLIERLDTSHRLRSFLPLGERIVLHASSAGLAYLSTCSQEYIDRYLAGPLPAQTPDTICDPARLRTVLAEVRERGYAVNVGGLSAGISSVGAAIGTSSGPIGALSISGPSSRLIPERFAELGMQAHSAAARIGQSL